MKSMRYAELHCKTNFSFLEGASHADELVRQAAELGYRALAVTDRNSLAGGVRANIAAKEVGLPLVIGAEIMPLNAPPVVLWATDRPSYGRLCRLITRGRRQAPKGKCALTLEDAAEFAEGVIAGVVWQDRETRRQGEKENPIAGSSPCLPFSLSPCLSFYRDIFRDRCYLLAELHYGADDQARLPTPQNNFRAA